MSLLHFFDVCPICGNICFIVDNFFMEGTMYMCDYCSILLDREDDKWREL